MPTLRQIKSFINVADSGSFAKAAEKAYVSSTALIQQINMLEENIGFTLFHRNRKGISLTESGTFFYTQMRQLLNSLDQAVEEGQRIEKQAAENLLLGYVNWRPSIVAREFVSFYHQCGGQKRICLSRKAWGEIAFAVKNGELDACISPENEPLRQAGLQYIRLESHPLYLGIPLKNPLSQKRSIVYEDLAGQTLVVPPQGYFDMTDQFCQRLEERHVSFHKRVEADNLQSNLLCLQENACRINSSINKDEDPQLAYRPLESDVSYCICFAFRPEKASVFKDILPIVSEYAAMHPHAAP